MAITTKEKVKTWLGITNADKDAVIDELIVDVQALLEALTDRKFDSDTYTENHDGNGAEFIYLKQYPITAITSVHDSLDRTFDANSLIDSDDYYYESESGRLTMINGGRFSRGLGNVQVVYDGGFASIPADLDYCAKRIIAEVLKLGRAQNQTPVTNTKEFVRNVIEKDNHIKQVLDKYQKVA